MGEYRWEITILSVIAVIFAAIIWFAFWSDDRDEKSCTAKGGHRIQTGTSTTYVQSGKVMVPITSPIYTCVVPS